MAKSILTETQTKILNFLSNKSFFQDNFYLTGGTALAEFYLHHRLSEDLDFFSELEIDKFSLTSLAKEISMVIGAETQDVQESYNRNLVYFNIKRGVLKTEFTYFPFPSVEKPKKVSGIAIDSLTDIATNKFFTIYQKPSARHFIDLYLILTTKNYTWAQLEKLARIKFDTIIDPIQLGSKLIKSATISDLPRMLIKLPEDKWRNYFMEKAQELKDQVIK